MNQCSPPWSGSTTSSWYQPSTPCWSRRAPRPSRSRFWSKNSSRAIIAPRLSTAAFTDPGAITRMWTLPPGSENAAVQSEEHTSELQSLRHLVCRLLLEKKKKKKSKYQTTFNILRQLNVGDGL